MKRTAWLVFVSVLAAAPLAFAQDGWKTFTADDYGFSMLVPEGAAVQTREWDGGWGGLLGTHDGVTLFGIARLGTAASAEEIEKFGVKLTGIPAASWKQIDKGSGNGWTWYRTVEASAGSKLVFGGYGVGTKGSYLLLLETTPADFKEHRADYEHWYENVRLQ